MARMIPSGGPVVNASRTAEPTIYRAIAEQLPDDFTVIHSLPWLAQIASEIDGRAVPTGEIDFLILHPKLGILAIENKGGALRYDHPYFVLTRTGEKIDPVTQVRRGAHALARWLTNTGAVHFFKIGYALAFPESVMQGKPLPPALADITGGKPETIVIDRPSLPRIGKRIIEIMQFWKQTLKIRDLTREAIDRAVSYLCPIVDYSPRWIDRIQEDTERWLLLTPEQSQRLELFSHRQRVVLTGRSGTGKTLLACAHARQLAKQGKRVLFLVYNAPLAEHLRSDLKETSIQVFTFHQLCRYAAARLGWTKEAMEADDWFKVKAFQALDEAIRAKKGAFYDALVIDETQVLHIDWIASLEKWFEDKPIMVCCDETQVFSFEECSQSQDIARIIKAGEPLTLTANMRSPYKIFERLQLVAPTSYEQVSFRPVEPDTLVEYIESDPLERLHMTLRQLHKEEIPSQSILVVHTTHEPPSYKPGIEQLVGKTLSVYRARGLESPIVIIWSSGYIHDNLLASSYSRATSRCIAIYSLSGFIPGSAGKEVTKGVFYQSLQLNVQGKLEAVWPPHKKFSLTPIVINSAEIYWSHDWGGWFIPGSPLYPSEEEAIKFVESSLWAAHLLVSFDSPVYILRTDSQWVFYYSLAGCLSGGISYEGIRLEWCGRCQWWRIVKVDRTIDRYYCVECATGKKSFPVLPSAQNIKQLDEILADLAYNKLETSNMSIFLLVLRLWRMLSYEQQAQVTSAVRLVTLSKQPVTEACRLLTGMRVVKAHPGEIIDLKTLRSNYWHKCPWLVQHMAREKWDRHMSATISLWINHKWIEKVNTGVYRRLPTPHQVSWYR